MALSSARGWLVDKSVLARAGNHRVQEVLLPRITAGTIAVCLVTELEVGFSARSTKDYRTTRETMLDHLAPVLISPKAEHRAREVQAALVRRGHHRGVSIPDLLVAAVAEAEHLTVLHYDADFELVARITAQPVEWVVPRGSVD